MFDGNSPLLTWCPIVTRRLVGYNSRGEIKTRRFTITAGAHSATVSAADVADGKAWLNHFPDAVGVGEDRVRKILRNIVDDQASRLPMISIHAMWQDGRLILPPCDTLPRGYGVEAGTLDGWRLLLSEVARSPRMALVMGLAAGGLYVEPLGLQSFMVHLAGRSSIGKTTTMSVAAALFGNPLHVIAPWSVTAGGPTAWLQSLSLLSGFRDELGASGFTPAQLEKQLFTLLQGAQRDRAGRDQSYVESQGSWYGCLLSSGNDGVVGRIANEGIAARVVELSAPLTLNAAHSERLDRMAEETHGQGLRLIAEHGPSPLEFSELIRKALEDIGAPEGGPMRRLAKHLAVGVAGCRVIATLGELPTFAAGVVEAAREVLEDLAGNLVERGARPSDRLLQAISEHMAAHPALWPTRKSYADHATGAYALREVAGWDLSEDNLPGEVAVLPARLIEIGQVAGITDPRVALAELRARKLLAPGDGRNLAKRIDVGGKKQRAYLISGLQEDETPAEPPAPGQVTTPEQRPAEPVQEPLDAPELPLSEPTPEPVPPGPCVGEGCFGDGDVLQGGQWWHRQCLDVHELARVAVAGPPVERPAEPKPAAPVTPVPAPRQPARPAVETVMGDYLLQAYPGSTREDRQQAEALWHKHMRNIAFRGPHATARAILNGALKHAKVPELPPFDVADLAEVFEGNRWRAKTWIVPGATVAAGDVLRAADINGMYLSAAEIELGTGPLTYRDELAEGDLKRPGYVLMGDTVPEDLPHGLDGRIVPGMWVPNPLALYLVERGFTLNVARVAVWQKSRRWLRPHASLMRDARKALIGYPDPNQPGRFVVYPKGSPEEMALSCVKPVYTRMFGGLLRSDKHNAGGTLRPDWSDMIIATGQARMFRALDKVNAPVLMVHVDAAVWLAPAVGTEPAGLVLPEDRQLGKFKPAGWGVLDLAGVRGYQVGQWKPVAACIDKTRK